jgi:hypothetical protein
MAAHLPTGLTDLQPPLPPFLPESEAQFATHVTANSATWFQYCQSAYSWIEEYKGHLPVYQEQLQAVRAENSKLAAVVSFQKEQFRELNKQVLEAEMAKERAIAASSASSTGPTVASASDSTSTTPAATSSAATGPATPVTAPVPTRLSERLPDPEKFSGDRKDLRRFVSQIQEKLIVNADRFPTPQSRMAYLTNRLTGVPYAQALPYIRYGVCQLSDYPDILDILERAYGDPNRVNNARTELFRFKQTNKEFSTFFAEFQRLGLEAEMTEESLSALLEQAVSQEVKEMLVHSPPTSRKYLDLAAHLQDLENRRRYYSRPAPPATPTRPVSFARPVSPALTSPRTTRFPQSAAPATSADPMDLSTQRRHSGHSDRETGNCFRCHRAGHRVKDCPYPDNRPASVQHRDYAARQARLAEFHSSTPSPVLVEQPRPVYPDQTAAIRSAPSPPYSENGTRLG